jgi:hypothetical protein
VTQVGTVAALYRYRVKAMTAERDPAVLRAIARHRDSCAGVYGSCVAPGVIRIGDPVIAR